LSVPGDPQDERLAELCSRLEDLAEELADMSRSKLREAIGTDDPGAIAEERRLTRARRSVLKAASLLRGLAE
jgi:hypothetical protein